MTVEPLVHTTREYAIDAGRAAASTSVENVHYGSIAVVDLDGAVVHRAGDPHWSTFTRSTLKPFQALPFVRDDGPARAGWSSREIALLCASHSGEPMHVGTVASMLASVDCDASHLQCGCHVPGWYAATGTTAPADGHWSPLEHNCSGKHAGFLAACRSRQEPVASYLDPASPLQTRVAAAIADACELPVADLPTGIDGCSAPNFALPLSRLAMLYARLAQGRAATRDGDVLEPLRDAMTRHPDLVSGTDRSDLALMSLAPGDWVTKIGADGVQAIGIRSAGLGIAIKVVDGHRDALYVALIETLAQLGLIERPALHADERFAPWYRRDLHNVRGTLSGRILPAFKLRPA